MSLQELHYSDRLSAVEFNPIGSEASGPWTSFGLVDVKKAPTRASSNWRKTVTNELVELLKLRPGWDGHNSGPISLGVAAFTLSILNSVMRSHTPSPAIVPVQGGSVQLEWHRGGVDIELIIYRPGDTELSVHYHDGRDGIEEVALSANFEMLGEALEELV